MMCVLKLNYNMSDRYWKVSRDVTLASAVYPTPSMQWTPKLVFHAV